MYEPITIGKLSGLTSKECKQCYCGIANQNTRIVGGWMTKIHEYPWVVALAREGRFFCAGTLINDRYIMTAAHCVKRRNKNLDWVKKEVRVILSEHNRKNPDDTVTEIRKVSKVIVHPNYGNNALDSDIALLKLDQTVKYRQGIRPACLPPRRKSFTGEWAVIAGWGTTSEQGSTSETLREAYVQIMSWRQCVRRGYGYETWKITENMLCAGDRGVDSCQGDSGGPLMLRNQYGQMYPAGIISWGEGCARPYKPGVYTKVNNFLDWIIKNTEDACYCY
ncbi:UNVERIFIED_CONTAM: hypothetical protein PYX00_002904 [Menopon gallinae]|uniref:Peptidase S1 domain-containing protein n=1 Tax=Menopon gallinae TaxID=328185 RepID=A0AAW2HYF6_9NEOP